MNNWGDTHYSSRMVSAYEVKAVIDFIDVIPIKLANMLDMGTQTDIYNWRNGVRRPSAKYWVRLCHLVRLKAADRLDLEKFVGVIYWDQLEKTVAEEARKSRVVGVNAAD